MCPEDNYPLHSDPSLAALLTGDPMVGLTLDDKYRLEKRLGVGGMGTVYRATHLLIDRPVAVKVLNPRFVEDEAAQVRFRREAKAAGRLQHTNAVGVTDFGRTADGYVYIVMELLEGRTLREVLAKEAPLDTARSVSLMLQTSAAVAAAHEAGIIHRDLKPANIFVVRSADAPAVVKVLDFGIAKLAAESLDDDDPKSLTLIGVMIGTPRYMSPEQCDGADLTPASDVYSLGVILYELLSGVVPFSGASPLAIAMKHASEAPRPLREFVPSIPLPLEQVVLHALEKRPEDRPANAAEFRNELLAVAERLGLEHAAATSAPDLISIRNVGTESPSGRLVIDISRLRENRAATSGANELTLINPAAAAGTPDNAEPGPSENSAETKTETPSFDRVNVELGESRQETKRSQRTPLLLAAAIVVALLIIGWAIFSTRSQVTEPATDASPVISPSPTAQPSRAPRPSPTATMSAKSEEKKLDNANANKKKGSKVKSALKKVKNILTKPF